MLHGRLKFSATEKDKVTLKLMYLSIRHAHTIRSDRKLNEFSFFWYNKHF